MIQKVEYKIEDNKIVRTMFLKAAPVMITIEGQEEKLEVGKNVNTQTITLKNKKLANKFLTYAKFQHKALLEEIKTLEERAETIQGMDTKNWTPYVEKLDIMIKKGKFKPKQVAEIERFMGLFNQRKSAEIMLKAKREAVEISKKDYEDLEKFIKKLK